MPHDDLPFEKPAIRRMAKQLRKSIPVEQLSGEVVRQLEGFLPFQSASVVLTYAAMPGEVDLSYLMKLFPDKRWLLPRIGKPELGEADNLFLHMVRPEDPLEPHGFGMKEPHHSHPAYPSSQTIDLILLPGLAFDPQGHRLGFGKGYYDRFIASLEPQRLPWLVGVVPDELLLERLPQEPWDVPVHYIVTPTRILKSC